MPGPCNIFYFSPYDLLRPRTNQVSDMRLCEGFAINKCNVTLFAPYVYRIDNINKEELFKKYGIEIPFLIKYLPTKFKADVKGSGNLLLIIFLTCWINLRVMLQFLFSKKKVIIMSRSPHLIAFPIVLKKIFFMGAKNISIIIWVHEVMDRPFYKWTYRNADGVVGTNSSITEDLNKIAGIDAQKTAVSLNPVSERQVNYSVDKISARKTVNLVMDKPLVVYTGKLGEGIKEIEYLLKAAKLLPQYAFLFTGGKPAAVGHYKNWCSSNQVTNVHFTGYIPDYTMIINYQFAADVLVSYYTRHTHDVRYSFPNKICEYMITGNPIVTPEFPATRDVLNRSNAIFVEPENIVSLVEGIKAAVEDSKTSHHLALQAQKDVKEFTFGKRTKMLLDFFESLN
ncbi:MAG TPA: glycosyltransferase [Bacteroidia bacterium]|nr:glycosyltransferase [Bacteroidia bacterium]